MQVILARRASIRGSAAAASVLYKDQRSVRTGGGKQCALGLGGQLSENERIGNHVVDVVAICAGFVN